MIDVFYQYLFNQEKWQELKYSLRSLDAHLKSPYRVWIVGDMPDWIKNVNHIPHQRTNDVWCSKCLSANEKIELVFNHHEIGESLLEMSDDHYFLHDITEKDLDIYLAVNHSSNLNHTSSGIHKELLLETFKSLTAAKKSTWNCETHTPRLYSKILLQEVFEKYQPKENRLLASTLYFNEVYNEVKPHVMQKPDKYKAGFYGLDNEYSFKSTNTAEIQTILSGKTFLNHNDDGWSVSLAKVIEDRFPDKSKFEI